MTKKELNIRKNAFDTYKDDQSFYKTNNTDGIKVFDIEKAIEFYKKSKKRKKKQTNVTEECTDIEVNNSVSYNYDISKLFRFGYNIIDYEALEEEWKHRNKIANEYEYNRNYTVLFLSLWFKKYVQENDICFTEKKIIYNDRHYALRNDDLVDDTGKIYLVRDFIKFTKDGVIKYKLHSGDNCLENKTRLGSAYKSIGDLIKMYFYLFKDMGIDNKDLMFINILNLLFITVDLNSWIYETEADKKDYNYFSPKVLKDFIDRWWEYGNERPFMLKSTKSRRLQKLFLEPGYEQEGKANYLEDKQLTYKNIIIKTVDYLKTIGKEINNINVYVETKRRCNMSYKKFIGIVNKHKIDIGPKYKMEIVSETEIQTNEVNIGNVTQSITNVYKKEIIKKGERKKQERSKWHEMVRNGAKYEEVIKEFPEVSKDAYKKAKYRLKNKL